MDATLVTRASRLARHLPLRGYDAVHAAAAEAIADPDVVAASGDRRLLAAWLRLGLDVIDTTAAT